MIPSEAAGAGIAFLFLGVAKFQHADVSLKNPVHLKVGLIVHALFPAWCS